LTAWAHNPKVGDLNQKTHRLIDAETFAKAQQLIGHWPRNPSDAELLDGLKMIVAKEGKISVALITATPDVSLSLDIQGTTRIRSGLNLSTVCFL